ASCRCGRIYDRQTRGALLHRRAAVRFLSSDIPHGARWACVGIAGSLAVALGHGAGAGPAIAYGGGVFVAGATAACSVRGAAPATPRERLLTALVLVPMAAAALFTLAYPVNDWDAVAIWYAKARAIVAWQPLSALPFAPYPDLGPVAWAAALRLVG